MQALRHTLLFITTFLVLSFFTKCNSPIPTENSIEKAALKLADNIDSSSIFLLKKFCFGKRGDLEFWQRVSAGSSLYSFSFKQVGDTSDITIFRPFEFVKDFPTNYPFDTSKYYQVRFSKLRDTVFRIASITNQANESIKDTLLLEKQLFPYQDPFETLSILTKIKDTYSFIGTSYRGDIGDFIEFWLSPEFKLTYLPDTLNMNPKFKKYWLDDFSKGKQIKQHWSLQKVYER
jgi:hypothetical protein